MPSTPSTASWGCRPTVAHTPSWARAVATAAADCAASVPTVMSRVTPAWRASAMTSTLTPSYGTWQWLSVHIG